MACPYQDCSGESWHVWYWGWYRRLEGSIPLDLDRVCGDIPLRRFLCKLCGRTFSWRPIFLVYGHRLAVVTYQQNLKNWALNKPGPSASWYELGVGGRKSFLRKIRLRLPSLLRQLGCSGPAPPHEPLLWFALRRSSRQLNPDLLPAQFLCLAMARCPNGSFFRLTCP